jgi:hypothetical protein
MSDKIISKTFNGKPNANGDIIDPAGVSVDKNFPHNKINIVHGDGKVEELKGYHIEPEIIVKHGKPHLVSISLCKNR